MPKFSEQKDTFVRCLAATQTHTAPSAAPTYLPVGIFMRENEIGKVQEEAEQSVCGFT